MPIEKELFPEGLSLYYENGALILQSPFSDWSLCQEMATPKCKVWRFSDNKQPFYFLLSMKPTNDGIELQTQLLGATEKPLIHKQNYPHLLRIDCLHTMRMLAHRLTAKGTPTEKDIPVLKGFGWDTLQLHPDCSPDWTIKPFNRDSPSPLILHNERLAVSFQIEVIHEAQFILLRGSWKDLGKRREIQKCFSYLEYDLLPCYLPMNRLLYELTKDMLHCRIQNTTQATTQAKVPQYLDLKSFDLTRWVQMNNLRWKLNRIETVRENHRLWLLQHKCFPYHMKISMFQHPTTQEISVCLQFCREGLKDKCGAQKIEPRRYECDMDLVEAIMPIWKKCIME